VRHVDLDSRSRPQAFAHLNRALVVASNRALYLSLLLLGPALYDSSELLKLSYCSRSLQWHTRYCGRASSLHPQDPGGLSECWL